MEYKWFAMTMIVLFGGYAASECVKAWGDKKIEQEAIKAGLVQRVDKETGKIVWVRE